MTFISGGKPATPHSPSPPQFHLLPTVRPSSNLSIDVNLCGAGLVHDPSRPSDHKTMYQIISSSIVNVPPPSYVLRLLHNNRPLYVPANGHRSTHQVSDTKEDMMEIFAVDVDGRPREWKRLMGRRNYGVGCIFDPEM